MKRSLRPVSKRRPATKHEKERVSSVYYEAGKYQRDRYEMEGPADLYFDERGEVWARLGCRVEDLPKKVIA